MTVCSQWCAGSAIGDGADDVNPAGNRTNPDIVLVTWEIDVAGFSQWFVDEVLSLFDRSSRPEIPAQYYVSLHTSSSSATGAGTEVADASYARQAVSFERVTDLRRQSTAEITFPAASAAYSVASLALYDSLTGGNFYGYGNLTEAVTLAVGQQIVIGANKIVIDLS